MFLGILFNLRILRIFPSELEPELASELEPDALGWIVR